MPPRGKFSKPSRGGGKHFSRDIQPLDKYGNPIGMWRDPAEDQAASSSSEGEEEDSSLEGSSADIVSGGTGASIVPGTATEAAEMTREERRAAAKAKKQTAIARRRQQHAAQPGDLPPSDSNDSEDSEDSEEGNSIGGSNAKGLPANPNHTAMARSQLTKPQSDVESKSRDPSQLTRREREAIEAQQARERYLKLHAEGKTEEARSDLARLAIIREQREATRARKEAEKEEKAEMERERVAAREKDLRMREAAEAAKARKIAGRKKK